MEAVLGVVLELSWPLVEWCFPPVITDRSKTLNRKVNLGHQNWRNSSSDPPKISMYDPILGFNAQKSYPGFHLRAKIICYVVKYLEDDFKES